jgi:hypothetical protein
VKRTRRCAALDPVITHYNDQVRQGVCIDHGVPRDGFLEGFNI